MATRILRRSPLIALTAALVTSAVSGCGQYVPPPEPALADKRDSANEVRVTKLADDGRLVEEHIVLDDGRIVTCLRYYKQGGLDCDWAHAEVPEVTRTAPR